MAFGDTPPAAPPAEGAPAAPESNPWEPWGQVFQDPAAVNPHEVHQHYQWVQDLRSDDLHQPTLERALRDWGYIQEGESLTDIQKMLEERRNTAADPFAAMRGQGDPGAGGPPADFDDGELMMDPHSLREVWQADQQRMRDEMRQEFENQQASARLELELERQLDRVVGEKKLEPDDRADLWSQVQYRLQTGQVRPDQLSNLVSDTYAQAEARFNRWMAARVAGDGNPEPPAPAPGNGGGGAAPTQKAPVKSFRDIAKASMQRLAEGDD
jgi:hypothetical protein